MFDSYRKGRKISKFTTIYLEQANKIIKLNIIYSG